MPHRVGAPLARRQSPLAGDFVRGIVGAALCSGEAGGFAVTRALLVVLALTMSAPCARAGPTDEAVVLRDFFAGTLEIDVPFGGPWSAKRYLAPDHTYRETGSDGDVRGTWVLQDGKVCTTADRLLGEERAKTYCTDVAGKHAGDMWRAPDPVTGNAVFFKLSPGRT